jgi:hypothetical protein
VSPLTHRAPPSGSGVEAVTGQRVECPDWRKEASDEPGELLPTEACRLTAPLERRKPEPLQFVESPISWMRALAAASSCLSVVISAAAAAVRSTTRHAVAESASSARIGLDVLGGVVLNLRIAGVKQLDAMMLV